MCVSICVYIYTCIYIYIRFVYMNRCIYTWALQQNATVGETAGGRAQLRGLGNGKECIYMHINI